MNPTAISFAVQVLEQLPALIAGGIEVKALIDHTAERLRQMQTERRDPTPDEWAALNKQIDTLRSALRGDQSSTT